MLRPVFSEISTSAFDSRRATPLKTEQGRTVNQNKIHFAPNREHPTTEWLQLHELSVCLLSDVCILYPSANVKAKKISSK